MWAINVRLLRRGRILGLMLGVTLLGETSGCDKPTSRPAANLSQASTAGLTVAQFQLKVDALKGQLRSLRSDERDAVARLHDFLETLAPLKVDGRDVRWTLSASGAKGGVPVADLVNHSDRLTLRVEFRAVGEGQPTELGAVEVPVSSGAPAAPLLRE